MNDVRKPIGYIFVPLYNFYLCLLPKFEENAVEYPNHSLKGSTLLKIVLLSFLIGVINFLSLFISQIDIGYGIFIAAGICGIAYPILIFYVFSKRKIDSEYLFTYFLIVGILTILITNTVAYLATQ